LSDFHDAGALKDAVLVIVDAPESPAVVKQKLTEREEFVPEAV
jgi:hypothetical protein